jgi:glycosyltransferase involved in cell wall biosynthesis
MWPFQGAEHYDDELLRRGLQGRTAVDPRKRTETKRSLLDRWTRWRKRRHWGAKSITFVATTPWMAEQARQSPVTDGHRVVSIPLGLDTEIYKPIPKRTARRALNLPPDIPLILFGAMNAFENLRKGSDLFQKALQSSGQSFGDSEVVIFGTSRPESPPAFGCPTHYLGRLHDDAALALVYSASDVMVAPSVQEAFGQTILEAMACGTPVVAFRATGPRSIVVDKETGYLATPYDATSLSEGIQWVIESPDRQRELSRKARQRAVSHYSLSDRVEAYRILYDRVLSSG